MSKLRRVLAICASMAGGFAVEMLQPVHCSLLTVAGTAPTRRKKCAGV